MNKKHNEALPVFNIETDGNGNPILATDDNGVLKRPTIKKQNPDNDIASEEEIAAAAAGSGAIIKNNNEVEIASRPKLSKSGTSVNSSIKPGTKPEQKTIPQSVVSIEEAAIRHLIETADKSDKSIKFEIVINSIDVDLFKILKKSYPEKSNKIIQIILDSNKIQIDKEIIEGIKRYYEEPSEENNN